MKININTEDEDMGGGFSVMPAGWYVAEATGEETRASQKDGTPYLSVEFTIMEGEYEGRKVWDTFNVQHHKEEVRKIARGQLARFADAVGISQLDDTEQLLGRPCEIKLKVQPETADYDARNQVKGYRKRGAGPTSKKEKFSFP